LGLSILIPDIATVQDPAGDAAYTDVSTSYLRKLAQKGVQDVTGIIVVPVWAGDIQSVFSVFIQL
jgi:hypothetical protein